jgi:LmbE family N-acetylglucosaminyl deacetylase
MRRFLGAILIFVSIGSGGTRGQDQKIQTVKGPDERVKTDILVVVAHPDDEGGVTPYLARAIYDQHRRVAVVFATRGGSGGNDYSREHGPALADIREQEARAACAKLGITNVWFLDGKDTASQNVLNSLANWGHGANLEALVRIVRLTRPEVMISWLPGFFIGENHGDHQASGVLATEAFDLAGQETTFPSQVAGASRRLEIYLENLTRWQPKKLYFFSDADDQKQFTGSGPAYSVKEISPSQKKPYWRLALDAATPHLTQFPEEIHQMTAMSDEQLNTFMADPQHQWWTEPMTLIFGKAAIRTDPKADVFSGTDQSAFTPEFPLVEYRNVKIPAILSLGGPWAYYGHFQWVHQLNHLPAAKRPEIAVKTGSVVTVPLNIYAMPQLDGKEVKIHVEVPSGWKAVIDRHIMVSSRVISADLPVDVETPALSNEELKSAQPQEVVVRGEVDGQSIGEVRLRVLLKASALPQ